MDPQDRSAHLRKMMRPYEGSAHKVVALRLEAGERHILATGDPVSEEDGALIFEIGSITKVFTAILLCLLVEEGRVDPKAPLSALSDGLAHIPNQITPERLVSHTSGLPTLPMPLWRALFQSYPESPYAAISWADLTAWFQTWPGKAPGAHAYSNLGVGLLGDALALQAGKPFGALLTERVLAPLGLRDTVEHLSPDQQDRFLQPRHPRGRPVLPWRFQSLAGAGCLRASAEDLGRFAAAVLQALRAPETPLERAICRSTRPILGLGRRGAMTPMAQCAGWLSVHLDKEGPSFLFHNGGTAGSTSALYICPETAQALVLLVNSGVAGNLWASTKLNWSNPLGQAQAYFSAT